MEFFKLIVILCGNFIIVQAQLPINGTKCPNDFYSLPCVNTNLTMTNELVKNHKTN